MQRAEVAHFRQLRDARDLQRVDRPVQQDYNTSGVPCGCRAQAKAISPMGAQEAGCCGKKGHRLRVRMARLVSSAYSPAF